MKYENYAKDNGLDEERFKELVYILENGSSASRFDGLVQSDVDLLMKIVEENIPNNKIVEGGLTAKEFLDSYYQYYLDLPLNQKKSKTYQNNVAVANLRNATAPRVIIS